MTESLGVWMWECVKIDTSKKEQRLGGDGEQSAEKPKLHL